jgi:hypothetical protein
MDREINLVPATPPFALPSLHAHQSPRYLIKLLCLSPLPELPVQYLVDFHGARLSSLLSLSVYTSRKSANMSFSDVDKLAVNTIRVLAVSGPSVPRYRPSIVTAGKASSICALYGRMLFLRNSGSAIPPALFCWVCHVATPP